MVDLHEMGNMEKFLAQMFLRIVIEGFPQGSGGLRHNLATSWPTKDLDFVGLAIFFPRTVKKHNVLNHAHKDFFIFGAAYS